LVGRQRAPVPDDPVQNYSRISWPGNVTDEDIDYELLKSVCRKRSLYRVAERLLTRMNAGPQDSSVPIVKSFARAEIVAVAPGGRSNRFVLTLLCR
jgi:hypothetical protein